MVFGFLRRKNMNWRTRYALDHLFKPAGQDFYTGSNKEIQDYLFIFMMIFSSFMLWIFIDVPTDKVRGAIYSFLLMFSGFLLAIDSLKSRATKWVATTGIFGDLGKLNTIAHGIILFMVILVIFQVMNLVFPSGNVGAFSIVTFLAVTGTNILVNRILLSGIAIPIIEETFFNVVIPTSIGARVGIVAQLSVGTFMFPFFHWLVYATSLATLITLGIMRFITMLYVIRYRNAGVGMTGHILMNTMAAIFS